nr:PIN domain-containing protein [Brasilonema bromeliae]
MFDTSVLIAAFEVSHPRHSVCLPWLQQAQTQLLQGFIATHTLAELYSVLTRLPVKPSISPYLAQQLIVENLKNFEVISLDTHDYQMVIAQMVNLNLTGGGTYDALIAQAAIKARVDILLTLNPNHFTRLGEEIAQLVQTPL